MTTVDVDVAAASMVGPAGDDGVRDEFGRLGRAEVEQAELLLDALRERLAVR